MAQEIVIGVADSEEHEQYKFKADDIKAFVCNDNLSDAQVKEIADILACNTELYVGDTGEVDEDGCLKIIRANFNDSFRDMEEDMINDYAGLADNQVLLTIDPEKLKQFKEIIEGHDDSYTLIDPIGFLRYMLQEEVNERLADYAHTVMDQGAMGVGDVIHDDSVIAQFFTEN